MTTRDEGLLLGIDVGTSSSKGVLATVDGRIVATAERPHALSLPKPGWAEHDAEAVWWSDAVALCRDLVPRATGPILAVCPSGIGACLLPAGESGEPLRPAILYGIDTRATREIEELTARYGAERIIARGGAALSSQAIGPKLLWLRHNEPEVWRQTRKVFMASSYLVWRLTGRYVLDHHSASQCWPLYDLAACAWASDWADDVAPGLSLPPLVWPAEVAGAVTPEAAAATGLPAGTAVAAGTVDAWAEGASVGAIRPGDVMLMYGTTIFITQTVESARPHPSFWCTNGIFPGSWTLAAGMATSGALTAWLRGIAGSPPFEELVREAAAAPAGSGGLVVLPYFAGERTPLFDPDARGLILGLTLGHGRGHLYRALLEGTAYGVRHIFETLGDAGVSRIVAVGGGTRGGLWTHIVSDVTGMPQEVPEVTIGASYGDAWLAGVAIGAADPRTSWSRRAATIVPTTERRELYDRLYRIYREVYPATAAHAHALAALQREGPAP